MSNGQEQTFYFDASELTQGIRNVIAVRFPAVAAVIDVNQLLSSMIDVAIYGGANPGWKSPYLLLSELRVPSDIIKETIEHCCSVVQNALAASLGEIDLNYEYEWEVRGDFSDLVVTKRQRGFTLPRPRRISPQEELRMEVQAAMDNGDYIPESIRRIVDR